MGVNKYHNPEIDFSRLGVSCAVYVSSGIILIQRYRYAHTASNNIRLTVLHDGLFDNVRRIAYPRSIHTTPIYCLVYLSLLKHQT